MFSICMCCRGWVGRVRRNVLLHAKRCSWAFDLWSHEKKKPLASNNVQAGPEKHSVSGSTPSCMIELWQHVQLFPAKAQYYCIICTVVLYYYCVTQVFSKHLPLIVPLPSCTCNDSPCHKGRCNKNMYYPHCCYPEKVYFRSLLLSSDYVSSVNLAVVPLL